MKYIKKYESSEPLDAGEHPENYCNDCGQRNPTWYAPNELWNALCERHEIICPVCFQKRADDAGVNIIFTTEDLKKQPVLDAGEWLDRNLPKNATLRMNGEAICGYLESFAQASITAKQKTWEEEKAELNKELDRRRNLLEDVINELDLSQGAVEKHGPMGTEPAILVKLVLQEKDKIIRNLRAGLKEINPKTHQ